MASRSGARPGRRPSLQRRFIVIAAVSSLVLFVLLVLLTSWNLLFIWILAWTPGTFLLYGYDKSQARRNQLRVPEISLLVAGAVGGCAGALGGMLLFRHKTAKPVFWVVNLASATIFAVLLLANVL